MPIQKVLEGKTPVKIWTKDVEKEAEQQLLNTASLPFVFKHVAAMPDVHAGKGSTIGCVVATKGAIVPACVSVDIGCGMAAVKLAINPQKILDNVHDIRMAIERSIPLGFNGNDHMTATVAAWPGWAQEVPLLDRDLKQKATHQLGSLGGGNHFVEVCLDTQGDPWVMLHSGSRGVGNKLATRFIDTAKNLMKTYFIKLNDPDLAYLSEGTKEFDDYMVALHWAQDFALENRVEMMRRVLKDIAYEVNDGVPIERLMEVNCHHNYVAKENHFGENVLVTRKGAVRARVGDMGIIPGSMGKKSFIVEGLGNEDSFCSCSHGAGRKMSRTKAKAMFTTDDLKKQTEGVDCRKDAEVLDEIPSAYKDIDQVMSDQSDLVKVVAELKQVLCVKG
jgi:tRNA-splicing ligase RtcB